MRARQLRAPLLATLVGLSALVGPQAAVAAQPAASEPKAVEQPPILPRESPLYGPPYRRGLALDVAVGVAICQPSLVHGGICRPRGGDPARPGVALRLGLGWRFNPHWYLSGAWIRQGHRPGGSFTAGTANGGMLAVRGVVPLPTVTGADSRVDLGFELGAGWSRRQLDRDEAPLVLSSSGAVVRPALILEGWVLADLALGLEIATQLNFHWQHCADEVCEPTPGPWVASSLERRWVDGFSVCVRATGLIFPRL